MNSRVFKVTSTYDIRLTCQALGPSMDFYSEKIKYLPVVICIFISPG